MLCTSELRTIRRMVKKSAYLFIVGLCLLLVACGRAESPLERILERGELRFITRNGPTTYFLGRSGEAGFEYELASLLAEELGVELVITQAFTLEALFTALDRDEADIAGAGLTLTEDRAARYAHSHSYARQRPQVVYKVGNRKPRELSDLEGLEIAVLANSSHEELLRQLNAESGIALDWRSVEVSDPVELLQQVNRDEADVAVVDSRDFFIQQNLVPRVERAFDLAKEREIVWYLPAHARDSELLRVVNEVMQRVRELGLLQDWRSRYFERDETISRVDTQTFVGSVERELKHYQQLIQIVAREEGLPWELLAAMSYQESHWDPKATSRTGVRGMMMLTKATAKDLGVKDRTDPGESLRGGARYFKQLRRRLPDDILEPDRTWMALAAYNIGRAHLSDARVLTERRGGDPHLWADVMETLPLLEEAAHYKTLRYGYARGMEAMRYVQNIRHYYNVLRWQTAREKRPKPPADVEPLLPPMIKSLSLRAL